MWECMVLALKVAIGGFLWWVVFMLFIILIAGIAYVFNKEKVKEYAEENGIKKPKWNGKPIVINGEKGDKKDE